MEYHSGTIDIYENMEQYLNTGFIEHVEKVHPGKSAEELLKKTQEAFELLKGEVRMNIDRVGM